MPVTIDNAKTVAIQVHGLFDTLSQMSQSELDHLSDLSSRPVGLRDTAGFNLSVAMISREEVSDLRRQLAEAIAFEKWMDGFIFAMQLVMMFAGGI